MPAYALGYLRNTQLHPHVAEYLERIQDTLDPFSGRFIVHGGSVEVMEGSWTGDVVLIEFPGMAEARAWYASPAYQQILPLRTDHVEGDVILVEGVDPGYRPTKLAARIRRFIEAG
jgi:uncharacterized protein (DUF1330 family)